MDYFFDWNVLSTLAGSVAATAIITQFIKSINVVKKLPTQIVSYIISLIILLMATVFQESAELSNYAILPLNAVLVSLTANGGYSAVTRIINGSFTNEDS